MRKALALGELNWLSASTNQTKTRVLVSIACWMKGAMVLSMSGSSMCGVMNRMARFIPGPSEGVLTVSRAMARDCKLGVVERKSGLKESRLMNQSFADPWLMREPERDT